MGEPTPKVHSTPGKPEERFGSTAPDLWEYRSEALAGIPKPEQQKREGEPMVASYSENQW